MSTIETSSGYPTTIAIHPTRGPRVCTTFGDDAETLESRQLRSHYTDCARAIDTQHNVWVDSVGSDADLEDGVEVWYPGQLDVQPTHILTIDGRRVASVLPVGDGCEPCELDANSGLSTRDEWIDGTSPSYSLVDDVLYCNGSIVVGGWSLDPIES